MRLNPFWKKDIKMGRKETLDGSYKKYLDQQGERKIHLQAFRMEDRRGDYGPDCKTKKFLIAIKKETWNGKHQEKDDTYPLRTNGVDD